MSNVCRGSSLNATARSLVRAAYGETAAFNDLAAGEFETVLGKNNNQSVLGSLY